MSKLPFVCLNVEPESEEDEEIDNTAEIKLEEALKLYQQALKLHALGPSSFTETQAAYEELCANEIFSYNEALSYRKREQAVDEDTTDSESGSSSGSENGYKPSFDEALSTKVEGAPSTLRQVVYLSYKNYGQFQLDRLQFDLSLRGLGGRPLDELDQALQKRVLSRIRKALELFTDALDKDDTDVELWRLVARLTKLLGSPRLARFCLESVLATAEDDDDWGSEDLLLSVVRADLQEVCSQIRDEMAANDLRRLYGATKPPVQVRKVLDPSPLMPAPSRLESSSTLSVRESKILRLKAHSWAALGKQIVRQLNADIMNGDNFENMGMGYRIEAANDASVKFDESRNKRRKTIENVDGQRTVINELDTTMAGVDGPVSPKEELSASVMARRSDDAGTARSPTQERLLPVRTLSTESGRQETGNPELPISSPTMAKTNPLKRSSDDAGIQQDPPESRSRSKRLRARETGGDDETTKDQRQQFEKHLKSLQDADRHLFNVGDTLLQRVSVRALDGLDSLPQPFIENVVTQRSNENDDFFSAFDDFRTSLKAWNSNKSSLILNGTGAGATATLISKGSDAGLASFLEHAKSGQQAVRDPCPVLDDHGLEEFISFINDSWLSIDDLALSWIVQMIGTTADKPDMADKHCVPKFLSFKWGPELKHAIHKTLSLIDGYLFRELEGTLLSWAEKFAPGTDENAAESFLSFVQSLFEIHLDMYDSMTKPASKVDQPSRSLQRARLQRWATFTGQIVGRFNSMKDRNGPMTMSELRHLYSMTLYLSLNEDSHREHIVACLQDTKDGLEALGESRLSLPNIDIMPEVSVEAIEQEISRLTTTDFFMSVFNPRDDDPVATIESLEPIIMPLPEVQLNHMSSYNSPRSGDSQDDMTASPSRQLISNTSSPVPPDVQKDQLLDFLSKSTASLRLSLWNRLSNAYAAIDAPPFVFLCTIHSLHIVLTELRTPEYTSQPEDTRTSNLLIWIRNLVDLIDKCGTIVNSDSGALDCMDESNLKLALNVASSCTRLFHVFAMWDDRVRLGQVGAPQQQAGGANAFKQAMNLLREMQVKTWRLLYVLLREATVQYPELYPDSDDDFLVYLAAVHSSIGLREYCRLGKKSFLKFVKSELLTLEPADLNEWRYQMAQVTYDLYDLRVLADSNTWMTLQEHNCPADQLDRATAREILPMIMAQIQGLNVKDIIKPDRRDFKQTIDRIQDLIGSPKASSVQQSFNRKQLIAFQKTAIRGSDLLNALRGIGGLSTMPVRSEYSAIAKSGWYFLIGYLRLAGFRSVKRSGPDSTKELDEAMTYLKFDIDFNSDKWESWYRLGQAYDAMLDEEITWTADRINNKMDDLVVLQRQAIHCYQMAVALAVRHQEGSGTKPKERSDELLTTISELYSDFGRRLYASSRPPFNGRAFSVKDHSRWFFTKSQVKFKARPFKEMSLPAVWLLASVLFKQALVNRPRDWHDHYMHGKCLWKLLGDEDVGGLTYNQVLESFARACDTAPHKDSKHPEKGPVLEPHHKLVSVVHKLVYNRKMMPPEEGVKWLSRTPYARKLELKDPKDLNEWVAYARLIMRNLRSADKANWHHRIMARAAKMAFEDETQTEPAEAAILQLTPHVFTKTMVVQVWRTLFERAGRHFVYTTQYVNFFIQLLCLTGDRTSLEALGRRVRKKQAEFIDHLSIWTRICHEHVKLLRDQAEVSPLLEENILFKLPYENFVSSAALLQTWAQPANADPPVHTLLSVIREAIDLKKLNLNLIPNQEIDDLIGDAYAKLYQAMVPGLKANATNEKNREAMRVDRLLMGDTGADDKTDTDNPVALTNPSGRAKIVGRMEVRRRAEALVQRIAIPTGPVKGKVAALAEAAAAQEEADESEDAVALGGDADINNDADDESELSELEDDAEQEAEANDGTNDEANEEEDDDDDEMDEEADDEPDFPARNDATIEHNPDINDKRMGGEKAREPKGNADEHGSEAVIGESTAEGSKLEEVARAMEIDTE